METFFSIDIETDGLCPALNSMLSIGCVAFNPLTGQELGDFSANLMPLPYTYPDPDTMLWWKKFPDQYEEVTRNRNFPLKVMQDFTKWIDHMSALAGSEGSERVAAYWKPEFDGAFIRYYAFSFLGKPIFGRSGSGLCIKTLTAEALHIPYSQCRLGDIPLAWTGSNMHNRHNSHNALEDAREQKKIYMAAKYRLSEEFDDASTYRSGDGL